MGETNWLDDREQRAWRALQFMTMRLNARLARDLASHSDLSGQDYGVLVALTDRPDGRLRLFELANELGWERSRVSHQVTRMVRRGYVTKEKDCPDRRGAFVVITPTGRAEIEAAAPGHVDSVRRLVIDRLTPQQLDELGAAAQIVLDGIDTDAAADEDCNLTP